MIVNDIIYKDGKYWVCKDKKKGFMICKDGVCYADVIGYASTFEQAKEIIELNKGEKQ